MEIPGVCGPTSRGKIFGASSGTGPRTHALSCVLHVHRAPPRHGASLFLLPPAHNRGPAGRDWTRADDPPHTWGGAAPPPDSSFQTVPTTQTTQPTTTTYHLPPPRAARTARSRPRHGGRPAAPGMRASHSSRTHDPRGPARGGAFEPLLTLLTPRNRRRRPGHTAPAAERSSRCSPQAGRIQDA